MKQDRKAEVKVGISVLIAIIISLFVLAWAKNLTLFSEPKELTIRFKSVAGLGTGDPVTINGVRKGYIEDIAVDKNTVLVKTHLDEDVDIRSDAEFSIMMLDLMGGKKLEISPGTQPEQINFEKIQTGVFLGDISTAMAMLSGMEQNIKTIVAELSITLNSVNEIVSDDQFKDNLKSSFAELNQLSNKISSMLDENRAGFKTLIDSTSKLVQTSNKLLEENSENINTTLNQTVELIDNSNKLVVKLDTLLNEIQTQQNNAGKILYDEQFLTDFKTSIENVKTLTQLLIEQLQGEGINVDANLDLF